MLAAAAVLSAVSDGAAALLSPVELPFRSLQPVHRPAEPLRKGHLRRPPKHRRRGLDARERSADVTRAPRALLDDRLSRTATLECKTQCVRTRVKRPASHTTTIAQLAHRWVHCHDCEKPGQERAIDSSSRTCLPVATSAAAMRSKRET